jgi:hypothetical protein
MPKRITDNFEENKQPKFIRSKNRTSEAIDLGKLRNSKTLDFTKQADAQ